VVRGPDLSRFKWTGVKFRPGAIEATMQPIGPARSYRDNQKTSHVMPITYSPRIHLSEPLVDRFPLETCEACIIVPARDENVRIEKCLSALVRQVGPDGKPIDPVKYEVIVLANNCHDETVARACAFGGRHPRLVLHVVEINFPPEKSYIGCARKLLMDEACRRLFLLGRPDGIIASTDADSWVDPGWIAGIMREVHAGADAVGGRIVADRDERLLLHPSAESTYLRQVAYDFLIAELEDLIDPDPFDPFPRHGNHIGASLAITAGLYARIGGLPDVLEDEDKALYKAILRSGARFRHSLDVRVTTSARLDGRVEHGFSAGLRHFGILKQQSRWLLVESPSASEIRLRARRALRELSREVQLNRAKTSSQVKGVSRALGISGFWLWHEISRPQTWGELMERVDLQQKAEGEWEQMWPPISLEQAVAALRIRLSDLRVRPRKKDSAGDRVSLRQQDQLADEQRASTSIR
jgi:Glycosyl transferase family 2